MDFYSKNNFFSSSNFKKFVVWDLFFMMFWPQKADDRRTNEYLFFPITHVTHINWMFLCCKKTQKSILKIIHTKTNKTNIYDIDCVVAFFRLVHFHRTTFLAEIGIGGIASVSLYPQNFVVVDLERVYTQNDAWSELVRETHKVFLRWPNVPQSLHSTATQPFDEPTAQMWCSRDVPGPAEQLERRRTLSMFRPATFPHPKTRIRIDFDDESFDSAANSAKNEKNWREESSAKIFCLRVPTRQTLKRTRQSLSIDQSRTFDVEEAFCLSDEEDSLLEGRSFLKCLGSRRTFNKYFQSDTKLQ